MSKKAITIEMSPEKSEAHEIAPAKAMQKVLEVSDVELEAQKINEIGKLLWHHENASEETIKTRLLRALELYESLEPADGAEGMLAMQMVGTHDAALECLKRAALPNQTFEGRDIALKHAQKLMALYTQQLAALNKHRGKGQQKVTVEHVNVEAGGQAIVGNVEAAAKKGASQGSRKHAIAHQDKPVLNGSKEPEPVKRGRD